MASHGRKRSTINQEQGFTLIEILIVIVIMGVLASVVVFAVQNMSGQSARTACKANFKTVETAAGAYAAQVGHYPTAGDNAAATPNGADIPGGLTSGMDGTRALFAQQPTMTLGPSGPWLKDAPANGHFAINLSSDGRGTVSVSDSAGSGQTSCAGVQ
jgi:general secretion pathway protein G